MSSDSSTNSGTSGQDEDAGTRSPEQIQAEIEETREQLGETIDALQAKLDVKSRARDRVEETKQQASDAVARGKDRVTDEQGSLKPAVPVAAGIAAAVVVGLVIWRRRR